MASSTGSTLLPKAVREYSTLGGMTGYALRSTNPSASSSRSCWVNILVVASGIRRCSSLNLTGAFW